MVERVTHNSLDSTITRARWFPATAQIECEHTATGWTHRCNLHVADRSEVTLVRSVCFAASEVSGHSRSERHHARPFRRLNENLLVDPRPLDAPEIHLLDVLPCDIADPTRRCIPARQIGRAYFRRCLARTRTQACQRFSRMVLRAAGSPCGQALRLMHGRPAEAWTLEARAVGVSRPALAERFTALVGVPAIKYLTRWRATSQRPPSIACSSALSVPLQESAQIQAERVL